MKAIVLFISGSEIFVILLLALLLFGSKQLPDIARGLGKAVKEIKKATNEIKREIDDYDITKDVNDIKKDLDNIAKK